MSSPTLVWFRRNLRQPVHTPLSAACAVRRSRYPRNSLQAVVSPEQECKWGLCAYEIHSFEGFLCWMWKFYLTSCVFIIESGNCRVTQITIKQLS